MRTSLKRTILVVEDDPDISSLLETALLMEGYEVETVENGQEAWDFLHRQKEKPSAIVLDLAMPVMDGWKFLELQAQSEKIKDIPTVIVSASSEERFPEAIPNRVLLRKPLDLNEFFLCVDELSR